jgi:hypothetical protein
MTNEDDRTRLARALMEASGASTARVRDTFILHRPHPRTERDSDDVTGPERHLEDPGPGDTIWVSIDHVVGNGAPAFLVTAIDERGRPLPVVIDPDPVEAIRQVQWWWFDGLWDPPRQRLGGEDVVARLKRLETASVLLSDLTSSDGTSVGEELLADLRGLAADIRSDMGDPDEEARTNAASDEMIREMYPDALDATDDDESG